MKLVEIMRDEAEYLVDLLDKQKDELIPTDSSFFVHRFSPHDIARNIRKMFGMVIE